MYSKIGTAKSATLFSTVIRTAPRQYILHCTKIYALPLEKL
jgi:hypothetical protein